MKICHLCLFVTLILNTRSLTCTGTRGNLLCSPPLRWTETFTSGTSGQNFRRKNQRKHQFISRSESLGSRPSLFKQLWEPRTFGGVVETATIWPGSCIAVIVVGFFLFYFILFLFFFLFIFLGGGEYWVSHIFNGVLETAALQIRTFSSQRP